jgi:hypothetical protein
MPDPLTHALLGAAAYPIRPWLGAALAQIADLPQIFGKWTAMPPWAQQTYHWLHRIIVYLPLICFPIMFGEWGWFLAVLSHPLIDAGLHSNNNGLWPLPVTGVDYWKTPILWIASFVLALTLFWLRVF